MLLVPLIVFLLLIGIVTGTSWFALSACTLLIVFQLARLFSKSWADGVTVERTLSASESNIGETIHIGLRLANQSRLLIPWILLEDALPKRAVTQPHQALKVIGNTAKLLFFSPRQLATLTYDLIPLRRGYFRLGPTLLETGDLLGLHRQHKIISSSNYLLVLPKLIPLSGIDVTTRRPMGDLNANDRTMEDPTQMIGIREYRPGDPLNRIHWKATARTGTLQSRIFQPTCQQGAMLIVDLHRDSNPDAHEPYRSDLAVTAAASIAHTLYLMNQPFGLITNGRDSADRYRVQESSADFSNRDSIRSTAQRERKNTNLKPWIFPAGTGAEKFAELHRSLARVERTDGLHLAELISESESHIPRHMAALFLLQKVDDEMAMTLGLLRRRGLSVSVILNDHSLNGGMDSAAKLVANRIPVYMLENEESISTVCQNLLLMR